MSPSKLKHLTSFSEGLITKGTLPGTVTAVAKDGKIVHFECLGMSDVENRKQMRADTIFRICSMSKPLASVALMILYDEGKVGLNDPVSEYIPELANLEVIVADDPLATKPANRDITIKHILTHTAGFYYSNLEMPGVLYREAKLAEGLRQEHVTLEENMKTLGKLPLAFQPGKEWRYGVNTDVVGRVVEVASGMPLDEFMQKRLFEPLGMKDTHFYLPKNKVSRVAAPYRFTENGGIERLSERKTYDWPGFYYSVDYPYRGPRKYFSGNAGLCSTVPDYVRFSQMLLNGGVIDGKRVLKKKTVDLMLRNHIGGLRTMYDQPFGLGFQIVRKLDKDDPKAWKGCCGWDGFFTTTFRVNPKGDWLVVSMSQVVWDMDFTPAWCDKTQQLAAEAIGE